ncbi:MAG TPA: hypothetical protein VF221_13400 [Chloroflexota bacterium]
MDDASRSFIGAAYGSDESPTPQERPVFHALSRFQTWRIYQEALSSGNPLPDWLQRRDEEGVVVGSPSPRDFEPYIEPQRIVEYYSR